MRAGSYGHRSFFCDAFTEARRGLEVDAIVWPDLSDRALASLRRVPFFGSIVAQKRDGAAVLAGYASSIADPVVRGALEAYGRDVARQARFFESFIARYEIPYRAVPFVAPAATRANFLAFGYRESLEAFLRWGVMAAAGAADLFPSPLLRIFDALAGDEARTLVFFANYVAYERAREGRDSLWNDVLDTLRGFGGAALGAGGTLARDLLIGPWFAARGATRAPRRANLGEVLRGSLDTNARLLTAFDARLKRPRFVPLCAQLALVLLRVVPRRAARPQLPAATNAP